MREYTFANKPHLVYKKVVEVYLFNLAFPKTFVYLNFNELLKLSSTFNRFQFLILFLCEQFTDKIAQLNLPLCKLTVYLVVPFRIRYGNRDVDKVRNVRIRRVLVELAKARFLA